MKPQTVRKRANELMSRGDIAGMVDEIRRPAVERSRMTLEGHLEALQQLRDAAAENAQYSAAISAEVARGKVSGLYVERVDATVAHRELPASVDDFV